MKKRLLLLLLMGMTFSVAHAQLPAGSVAPDFTVTDLDGNSHHLYDILNQGKTVFIDVSATWCGPCWNYHNTHALRTIWETYGPSGTDEAFVIFIEGDGGTSVECLYGPAGCVGGTQGNWVAGTPYPIADAAAVASLYQISYYPTIYMVCPGTNQVYETGQLPATGLWAKRNQYCDLTASAEPGVITNVTCFGGSNGSVSVQASGGVGPYTYQWSTGASNSTGVLSNLSAGNYACTVTPTLGGQAFVSDLIVEGPPAPISVALVESIAPGCNGVPGSALVEASGGWSNYSYAWSNGQQSEELINIAAGTYTVSVTDENGCVKTQAFSFTQAPPPVISIVPPAALTCSASSITINASASSSGSNYTYNWFAANGGHIVSGANTLTPVVDAAGTYSLQIINTETTCTAFGNTAVTGSTTPPTAVAGPAAAISCSQPTAALQGSGSGGNNLSYLWTASNGGNIVSGAGTLTPTVNAAGTYTLKVTNTANGCTSTSVTTVTGSNTTLSVAASGGTVTCVAPSVALNANTPASGATYAWTGPNNFSSSAASPVVSVAGTYTVVVSDPAGGCTGSSSAVVIANNITPGATAVGGALTCAVSSVNLAGSSVGVNTIFAWTGPNNFASSTQNPAVSASGTYQLVVTDTLNGCISTATANVSLNNTAPMAAATVAANLNCANTQIQINGTGSSQGNNFTAAWSTANGNIVSGANSLTPTVNAAGIYVLLVTNTQNGCTSTTSASVNQSPAVAAATAATPVLCNGSANGGATATATGGSGTFTYVWSTGANTATVSNLAAGSYDVIVTDSEGCTATSVAQITEPVVLAANATATPQTANGVNDGMAMATPTGGTATYTYLWSNAAATANIAGLAPGAYTVTVTDANNCTSVQVVTVNAFNCALAASASAVNVSCNGANDGTATVALSGAASPVTFAWSNGASTQSVTGLAPGTYTVEIMDDNNCPASLNVSVTQPSALVANATATGETAAGANDGTATASPVGGTMPYTYNWSTGAATAAISGLAPGTYTVEITDNRNCVSVQTVTVNSFNCVISTQFSVVNVTCFGLQNGAATVVLTGGTAPFTYNWSNGSSDPNIANVPGGAYSVEITDDNGCVVDATVSIAEPAVLEAAMSNVVNTICPNEPTGSAEVTANGGTGIYIYAWSNGATTEAVTSLTAGTYNVIVTDGNGCTAAQSATVTSNDTEVPVLTAAPATLALGSNGEVMVTASALGVTATDNCAVANITMSETMFNCDDLGAHVLIATATDASGNTSTTAVMVNIVDQTAPVLTCPVSLTRCPEDNIVAYDYPTAVDNCLSSGGSWELVAGLASGSEFPVGATTQMYSYTDGSGNTGTCAFDVIITTPAVYLANVTNASGNGANGAIDLSVSGEGPFTFQWMQNGEIISTNEDLTDVSAGTYQVVILDANGCKTSSDEINVANVVGTLEPSWAAGLSLRPNPSSGLTRLVFGRVPEGQVQVTVTDASGRLLLNPVVEGQMSLELNCENFDSGIYFVRLQTAKYTTTRKLIINR